METEFEVDCPTGKKKLKPKKVWVLPTRRKGDYLQLNVIASFECPDGTPVNKRIAVIKTVFGLLTRED